QTRSAFRSFVATRWGRSTRTRTSTTSAASTRTSFQPTAPQPPSHNGPFMRLATQVAVWRATSPGWTAMVDISVQSDRVVFEVEGLDKLWSLRSRLEIPLSHITKVEHDPTVVGRWWHGLKLMGTDVPGLFAAGTFYFHGELVFWDVRDPAK